MMSGAVYRAANAVPSDADTVRQPSACTRARSVLLVDDAVLIRNLAQGILSEAGYEAYSAPDGVAALRFLRERERPVDVVITDLSMPAMDGFELIHELRAFSPSTRVVLITGYVDAIDLAGSAKNRPDFVLPKPFRAAELLEAVSEVLELTR